MDSVAALDPEFVLEIGPEKLLDGLLLELLKMEKGLDAMLEAVLEGASKTVVKGVIEEVSEEVLGPGPALEMLGVVLGVTLAAVLTTRSWTVWVIAAVVTLDPGSVLDEELD